MLQEIVAAIEAKKKEENNEKHLTPYPEGPVSLVFVLLREESVLLTLGVKL